MGEFPYAPGLPQEVNERWSARHPIVVANRNSGQSGRKGRLDVVDDNLRANEQLVRLGVTLPSLPSEAELLDRLSAAEPVWSMVDGRRYRHAFVVLDYRHTHGILYLLGTGNGTKIDDDGVQQYVLRLAATIKEAQPCLVFAHLLHRMGRHAWGMAPAMIELERVGGFIGDRFKIVRGTGPEALFVFWDFVQAQEQGRGLPIQTRSGMTSKTAREMVNGRVAYHVNVSPPPGFTAVRLHSRVHSHRGDRILVLDSPDFLPPDAEVERGMPTLVDPSGRLVDQVANVRWLLSAIGTPGWSTTKLAAELEKRQFSHMTLTRRKPDSPVVDSAGRLKAFKAVLDNLHVYETGFWTVRMGMTGIDDLNLVGLIPPDGPWASSSDFDRIRRWASAIAAQEERRARFHLSGHLCQLNGRELRLRASPSNQKVKRPISYVLADPFSRIRVPKTPPIDALSLARVIADSIGAAGDRVLPLAGEPPQVNPELARAEMEVARLEADLAELQVRRADLLSTVQELVSSGVAGEMLRDLSDRYESLGSVEVARVAAAVDEARAEVAQLQVAHETARPTLTSDALLRLVALLADPTETSMRPILRENLSPLIFEVEPVAGEGSKSLQVTVTGTLRVGVGVAEVVIPIAGSFLQGPVLCRDSRLERIVAGLAAGVPLRTQKVRRKVVYTALLADRLGLPLEHRGFLHCDDPRILRVGVKLLLNPGVSHQQAACELGVGVELVERVEQRIRTVGSSRWCKPSGPLGALSVALKLARDNEGLVERDAFEAAGQRWNAMHQIVHTRKGLFDPFDGDGYRMRRCVSCGERDLSVPRFYEPVGLICRSCGSDAAGLVWPLEHYGKWMH